MKKKTLSFLLFFMAILLIVLFRNLLVNRFIIPLILGGLRLEQILKSIPEIFWWGILIILSFSLFSFKLPRPILNLSRSAVVKEKQGRLEYLENLIRELDKGSFYSGRQIALLLINLDRKNRGEKHIAFHDLEDELKKGELPGSIEQYTRLQFTDRKKNGALSRKALEAAVEYLERTAGGLRE